MTAKERYQLIRKKEQGLLTDDEYDLYIGLLKSDPTFYDDVIAYQLIEDTTWHTTGRGFQNAARKIIEEEERQKRRIGLPVAYPYWSVAAAVAVLVTVIWATIQFIRRPEVQLVRTERQDVFSSDSLMVNTKGYASGNQPIGSLTVQWFVNSKQQAPATYVYCRDTIKFSVRDSRDTLRLLDATLVYNPGERVLYWARRAKAAVPFLECASPQSF